MLCPDCGSNNPPIARFCHHCGTSLAPSRRIPWALLTTIGTIGLLGTILVFISLNGRAPGSGGGTPTSTRVASLTPVPTAIPPTPTTPTFTPAPTTAPSCTYIVRPPDTLYVIAERFNTTVSAIAEVNGITNVNQIYVGQRLVIPNCKTPPPSTPTPILATMTHSPTSVSTIPVKVGIGAYVRVAGTGGIGLRFRSGPGVDYITWRIIPDGEILYITGGPEMANGVAWWRAVDQTGLVGWAAERSMVPVKPPAWTPQPDRTPDVRELIPTPER